jgi:hypothetical protein
LEDLDVAGRVILKWFLKKWDGKAWDGFAVDSGSCVYGNDFPASVQSWESLE